MVFYEKLVFGQFWAAIEFGPDTVLTTRGQPFGYSKYTDEFWSYRLACLDHNAYVNPKKKGCVGLPGRVFFKGSPEWTQDAREYNDRAYPQREDAMRSNIRGSFAMPVFKGDQCIGVLEFVMTNCKDKFSYEMEEVCRALKEVGLQSSDPNKWIIVKEVGLQSDQNENLDIDTSKYRTTRKRKADDITCNDITKLFGQPKSHIAKKFKMVENTFSDVHRRYGIDTWPCKSPKIAKSSAHVALINGGAPDTSSDELKQFISWLMNDDSGIYGFTDNEVDTCMSDLISKDEKSVREKPDTSASPILLEMYSGRK